MPARTPSRTFRAVDDVVAGAIILAKKANLPLAALMHVSPIPVDEQYLTADYLYHDDHFVVMRVMCSTVELFEQVMHRHAGSRRAGLRRLDERRQGAAGSWQFVLAAQRADRVCQS